jgi:DNA-binding NarL/FixJ family response regulator
VIRVVIASPSAVTRAGLEALAASSPELQVVGSFPDLDGADVPRPDVILTTILPEEAGAPMVLLTAEERPAWTLDALRHGVRALLARDASEAGILAAVSAAAQDMAAIDARELEGLLMAAPAAAAPAANGRSELSARELEVLRMMADGAANKIIAWKLGVSEHTIKFHVASILAKLGASSRTEAVTLGIRKGLVLL